MVLLRRLGGEEELDAFVEAARLQIEFDAGALQCLQQVSSAAGRDASK